MGEGGEESPEEESGGRCEWGEGRKDMNMNTLGRGREFGPGCLG